MSAVVIWEKILQQAVTRIIRKIRDALTKLQLASMRLTATVFLISSVYLSYYPILYIADALHPLRL